ncbi:MAG: T9SS type A sorting domain-containing protein, partial [Candidatus Eisenbacteria sp.]|nr:T9SS type A sorting domain-containing protein [Candidatus Eisenbacteria bacterium]
KWTAEPVSQTVEHGEEVPLGPSDFTVTVTSGGSPLQDALVCVMSDSGDVYLYAHTGVAGEVVFSIEPAVEGTLRVTSTAMNHLPSESTAVIGPATAVEDGPARPLRLQLALTGNPARGEAGLVLGLPSPADVDVRVFDVTGRQVALLVSGRLDAGWNPIVWDGRSRSGIRCASGVYFCRAGVAGRTVSEKFVLLR